MPIDEREERDMLEGLSVLAKRCRAFYQALIEQKFPPLTAMELTRTWLQATMMKYEPPSKGPEGA